MALATKRTSCILEPAGLGIIPPDTPVVKTGTAPTVASCKIAPVPSQYQYSNFSMPDGIIPQH
jgi:hypothetical protein